MSEMSDQEFVADALAKFTGAVVARIDGPAVPPVSAGRRAFADWLVAVGRKLEDALRAPVAMGATMSNERIREVSFNERARWGECPVCGAKDGEACDSNHPYDGARLGRTHLGRLQRAPFKVKEVPCE